MLSTIECQEQKAGLNPRKLLVLGDGCGAALCDAAGLCGEGRTLGPVAVADAAWPGWAVPCGAALVPPLAVSRPWELLAEECRGLEGGTLSAWDKATDPAASSERPIARMMNLRRQ